MHLSLTLSLSLSVLDCYGLCFILELHNELGIHTGAPCFCYVQDRVPLGVQALPNRIRV